MLDYSLSTLWHNLLAQLSFAPDQPLMFSSGLFWVLFLLFLPVYALVKSKRKQMLMFVTAFSLLCFYKSSGWYLLLMVATGVIDWMLARRIAALSSASVRRLFLILSIMCSLGILLAFKYGNFILLNVDVIIGHNFQPLDIVLPVGISFYTFRTISYVVDVYKRKLQPTDSLLEYLFFISFFPCMIAGPIVRATELFPQIRANKPATRSMIYGGLWLILLGVLKKAVVADYVGQYVTIAFGNPVGYSGLELLMALLGYSVQLYCDFSGYSDMAIGIASVMGFRLPINFDFPYRSLNFTEFWRRWHITLSSWLRDYVYISLGGNRHGKARQYLNLMVTMLVGGLWHGAAWTFVIWGACHGLALCVHKACKPWLSRLPEAGWVRFVSWLVTFATITLLWALFRADSLHSALEIYKGVFTRFDIAYLPVFARVRNTWCIVMVLAFALHFLPQDIWSQFRRRFIRSRWWVKLVALIMVVQLVLQFANADIQPLIYAQF